MMAISLTTFFSAVSSNLWICAFILVALSAMPLLLLARIPKSTQRITFILRYIFSVWLMMASLVSGIVLLGTYTGEDSLANLLLLGTNDTFWLALNSFFLILPVLFTLGVWPFQSLLIALLHLKRHLLGFKFFTGLLFSIFGCFMVTITMTALSSDLSFHNRLGSFLSILAVISGWLWTMRANDQNELDTACLYLFWAQGSFLLLATATLRSQELEEIVRYCSQFFIHQIGAAVALALVFRKLPKSRLRSFSWEAIAGLGKTKPWLAIILSLTLYTLVGGPLSPGFFIKWRVIEALMRQGNPLLGFFALMTSGVGLVFVARLFAFLYGKQPIFSQTNLGR